MAKIEVRSHDIEALSEIYNADKGNQINRPQHLFIILTTNNGTQRILRGGPGRDGKILVENRLYELDPRDQNNLPPDWPREGIRQYSATVFNGSEDKALHIFDRMWERGQEINAGGNLKNPEYKPTNAANDGVGYNYNFWSQNSNTIITQVLRAGEEAASEVGVAKEFQENLLPKVNGEEVKAFKDNFYRSPINGTIRKATPLSSSDGLLSVELLVQLD